eukprot:g8985.t1
MELKRTAQRQRLHLNNSSGVAAGRAARNRRAGALHKLCTHDADGKAPLHIAAQQWTGKEGAVELMDLLFRSGAGETVAATSNGQRPDDVAGRPGFPYWLNMERAHSLFAAAPGDKAWRRRGLLLLCRARRSMGQLLIAGDDGVQRSITLQATGDPRLRACSFKDAVNFHVQHWTHQTDDDRSADRAKRVGRRPQHPEPDASKEGINRTDDGRVKTTSASEIKTGGSGSGSGIGGGGDPNVGGDKAGLTKSNDVGGGGDGGGDTAVGEISGEDKGPNGGNQAALATDGGGGGGVGDTAVGEENKPHGGDQATLSNKGSGDGGHNVVGILDSPAERELFNMGDYAEFLYNPAKDDDWHKVEITSVEEHADDRVVELTFVGTSKRKRGATPVWVTEPISLRELVDNDQLMPPGSHLTFKDAVNFHVQHWTHQTDDDRSADRAKRVGRRPQHPEPDASKEGINRTDDGRVKTTSASEIKTGGSGSGSGIGGGGDPNVGGDKAGLTKSNDVGGGGDGGGDTAVGEISGEDKGPNGGNQAALATDGGGGGGVGDTAVGEENKPHGGDQATLSNKGSGDGGHNIVGILDSPAERELFNMGDYAEFLYNPAKDDDWHKVEITSVEEHADDRVVELTFVGTSKRKRGATPVWVTEPISLRELVDNDQLMPPGSHLTNCGDNGHVKAASASETKAPAGSSSGGVWDPTVGSDKAGPTESKDDGGGGDDTTVEVPVAARVE